MRVLLATGLYPPEIGGPATYARLLEERLPKFGIDVSVVPFNTVRHLPLIIRHLFYAVILMRQARAHDLILVQDTVSTGVPAALASLIQRVPLVLRVPGDYAWEQGVQRFGVKESLDEFQKHRYGIRVELLRALQQFVAGRARVIIAPSEYLSKIIKQWSSFSNVMTIYNGIEIKDMDVSSRVSHRIVSSGRLVPWKGFKGLIEVVARHPEWSLEILGDGPDRGALSKQIRELNAEKQVRLRGSVPSDEARSIFSAAEVFVLNSSYEGLSHTLIEAMSVGAPVVATAVGGNTEVIENNVNGILVQSGDIGGLEKALERLFSDETSRKTLGEAAARRAKDFSIEKTLEATASLLQSCVSSR